MIKRIVCNGKSLWEVLTDEGKNLPSFCGGKGKCKKCSVRILEGSTAISPEDAACFSEEELKAGYRLACTSYPEGECLIETVPWTEEQFEILSLPKNQTQSNTRKVSAAIDLGTTTIAMVLLNEKAEIVETCSCINPQRVYGADVISRIEKAAEGYAKEMTSLVRKSVRCGIETMVLSAKAEIASIDKIVIAGNTVMEHLFWGYPLDGLAAYPFQPYWADWFSMDAAELYPEWNRNRPLPIMGFPSVSAFVGGDILAGLYAAEMQEGTLLLDLGTNGELALCHDSNIYTASTAAGPVFEGGSISCGMGSIPGAVSGVSIDGDELEISVIGGLSPSGICGTGVIEAMAELYRTGVIDSSGRLKGAYVKNGYTLARAVNGQRIVITQEDVRKFQLAKGAVRAGIQTLLEKAKLPASELKSIILSGGFGTKLDVRKAAKAGLLPREAIGITKAFGNTSLKGCIKYVREDVGNTEELKNRCIPVSLADEPVFQSAFLDFMEFKN